MRYFYLVGVVRNSHVTLGVMVRKRDMQPVCSRFNNVHVPCYMMPMCYFVPSSQQAYTCAEIIAAGFSVIQWLPDIDSWSIQDTVVSLIVTMPVTFIGSVDPVWLIASLWISNFVEVWDLSSWYILVQTFSSLHVRGALSAPVLLKWGDTRCGYKTLKIDGLVMDSP